MTMGKSEYPPGEERINPTTQGKELAELLIQEIENAPEKRPKKRAVKVAPKEEEHPDCAKK